MFSNLQKHLNSKPWILTWNFFKACSLSSRFARADGCERIRFSFETSLMFLFLQFFFAKFSVVWTIYDRIFVYELSSDMMVSEFLTVSSPVPVIFNSDWFGYLSSFLSFPTPFPFCRPRLFHRDNRSLFFTSFVIQAMSFANQSDYIYSLASAGNAFRVC